MLGRAYWLWSPQCNQVGRTNAGPPLIFLAIGYIVGCRHT